MSALRVIRKEPLVVRGQKTLYLVRANKGKNYRRFDSYGREEAARRLRQFNKLAGAAK